MGWWYWPKGWWCPRHPWPPAWARAWGYWWKPSWPYYLTDPSEEIKALEDLKKDLEAELTEISKRIEELKKLLQEKK
jgi:hypothetical protein